MNNKMYLTFWYFQINHWFLKKLKTALETLTVECFSKIHNNVLETVFCRFVDNLFVKLKSHHLNRATHSHNIAYGTEEFNKVACCTCCEYSL